MTCFKSHAIVSRISAPGGRVGHACKPCATYRSQLVSGLARHSLVALLSLSRWIIAQPAPVQPSPLVSCSAPFQFSRFTPAPYLMMKAYHSKARLSTLFIFFFKTTFFRGMIIAHFIQCIRWYHVIHNSRNGNEKNKKWKKCQASTPCPAFSCRSRHPRLEPAQPPMQYTAQKIASFCP